MIDVRGVIILMSVLRGDKAARFRLQGADIVVRALGGDETLVEEIRRNAGLQATLPATHPMRTFGETVEAEAAKRAAMDQATQDVMAGLMPLMKATVANEMGGLLTVMRQAVPRGAGEQREAAAHQAAQAASVRAHSTGPGAATQGCTRGQRLPR